MSDTTLYSICSVILSEWNYLRTGVIWEYLGPSIKYATLQGREIQESVAVCDRGRGKYHVASQFSHLGYFIIHIKPEIDSDV